MKTFAIDTFQGLVEHSILSTLPSKHSNAWGNMQPDWAGALNIVKSFGGTDSLWAEGKTVEQAVKQILTGAN